jgi:hypothetical protein
MNKHDLDLIVTKAKEEGDFKWSRITSKYNIASGQTPSPEVFNEFAAWCEHANTFCMYSPIVNNLRAFEAFLRAGKHMPLSVKIDNRKKADELYEQILKAGQ